jgi:hypothetical protein
VSNHKKLISDRVAIRFIAWLDLIGPFADYSPIVDLQKDELLLRVMEL